MDYETQLKQASAEELQNMEKYLAREASRAPKAGETVTIKNAVRLKGSGYCDIEAKVISVNCGVVEAQHHSVCMSAPVSLVEIPGPAQRLALVRAEVSRRKALSTPGKRLRLWDTVNVEVVERGVPVTMTVQNPMVVVVGERPNGLIEVLLDSPRRIVCHPKDLIPE